MVTCKDCKYLGELDLKKEFCRCDYPKPKIKMPEAYFISGSWMFLHYEHKCEFFKKLEKDKLIRRKDIFDYGLNPFELAVYSLLSRKTISGHKVSYSHNDIAKFTNMSERQSNRVVKSLVEKKFIRKEKDIIETGIQNVYTILDLPE